jgi:formylmethanofuran dehydrogenase subunit B
VTREARTIDAVSCLGCGCVCDDIAVTIDGRRITEARHTCDLGAAWFGDGTAPARVRVAGRDASLDEALDAAAALVGRAARPLVYLAPDLSCEAQREGVAIADLLRATLDSVTSATVMRSILAAQERGRAGATLGEVRNRADVIVFWGVDPSQRYPRFQARYAPEPVGLQVPDGRRSRTVIAVDVGDARGPADADRRTRLPPEQEVATLTALAALVSADLPAGQGAALRDHPGARVAEAVWQRAADLAPALAAARYAVIVADVEPEAGVALRDAGRASALLALSHALNARTRGALCLLRAGGNRSGADAVATWQTGFPAAIDFARGYPRYRPHEGTAGARLDRGEVDGVLVVGAAARLPGDLLTRMAALPCAAIGPAASESALRDAAVAIDTAVAGIHEEGTALRMDDVPLPLRALVPGPPAAAAILGALRDRAASGAGPSPRGQAASGPRRDFARGAEAKR